MDQSSNDKIQGEVAMQERYLVEKDIGIISSLPILNNWKGGIESSDRPRNNCTVGYLAYLLSIWAHTL